MPATDVSIPQGVRPWGRGGGGLYPYERTRNSGNGSGPAPHHHHTWVEKRGGLLPLVTRSWQATSIHVSDCIVFSSTAVAPRSQVAVRGSVGVQALWEGGKEGGREGEGVRGDAGPAVSAGREGVGEVAEAKGRGGGERGGDQRAGAQRFVHRIPNAV